MRPVHCNDGLGGWLLQRKGKNMEAAQAVPITEKLRAIKIGSYTVDNGSHSKHFAVRAVCEAAAEEIERSHEREKQLYGECLLLADVLRDAFEVVKTVEGEEQDECDKLTGLCLSIAHALALYDEKKAADNRSLKCAAGFAASA